MRPSCSCRVSSELAPEIREYWRASTTVVNAYVAPVVGGYLDRVTARLEERGVRAPFYVMGSSGGVMTAEAVRARPVYTVESGPAAGVAASLRVAERLGIADAITFDMGGTTAKVGLILGGRARVLREFEVGSHEGSGSGVKKASGYPILGSVVDLVEVGAGGGSIGWIDSGGHPRVGPRSAGADPGPGLLRPRRHRADRHRRQPRARPARRGIVPGRPDAARHAGRRAGDRGGVRPAARRAGRGRGADDARPRRRDDEPGAAPRVDPARLRPARRSR